MEHELDRLQPAQSGAANDSPSSVNDVKATGRTPFHHRRNFCRQHGEIMSFGDTVHTSNVTFSVEPSL
jgi:hypothetical protein